jgi:hypothetical protein
MNLKWATLVLSMQLHNYYTLRNSYHKFYKELTLSFFFIIISFIFIGFFKGYFTGQFPPLLPTHHVSCVVRINSGIPPIDKEQWSLLSREWKIKMSNDSFSFHPELTSNLIKNKLKEEY